MERFELLILGCGSAKPSARHFPSVQILNIHDKAYLIDCGEGSQIQMARFHVGYRHLDSIFISHMHGDHVLGLPGLMSTFCLLGRTADLNIIGPEGLGDFVDFINKTFCKEKTYKVNFFPVLDDCVSKPVFEDKTTEVYAIPLRHRIQCYGYLFREKANKPHIIREMTDFYGIPYYAYNSIKDGKPWTTEDGEIVPAERLTRPAEPPRAYAYISDTAPSHVVAENVVNVDLLYHEATFGKDNIKRAEETYHTTAAQAAEIATSCHVHRLIIGHFSSRYKDETPLLEEAQAIFPNTVLAEEGKTYTI